MNPLDGTISVSAQLHPNALQRLQAAGFEQIICHRPDAEAPDQPNFAAIREAAAALGLAAVYAPVAQGAPGEAALNTTRTALASGGKTVMYCASGTRSTIVWALLEAGRGRDIDAILDRAKAAGYDLGHLRDALFRHASSACSRRIATQPITEPGGKPRKRGGNTRR